MSFKHKRPKKAPWATQEPLPDPDRIQELIGKAALRTGAIKLAISDIDRLKEKVRVRRITNYQDIVGELERIAQQLQQAL